MSGVPVNIDFFSSVMFRSILLPPSSGILNFTVTDQFLYISVPTSFYQQIGLKFEEETSEMLRLEHGSVWC